MRLAACAAGIVLILVAAGCTGSGKSERYQGRLEAEKIRISSRLAGTIVSYGVTEGALVTTGQVLAVIDTDKLELVRKQQVAQLAELASQIRSLQAQINQSRTNLALAVKQLERTESLLEKGVATEGSFDEIVARKKTLEQQIEALTAQHEALINKQDQIRAAIATTDISIAEATIASPLQGTILTSYFHAGETIGAGAPVADIADLSSMTVKVHVPLRALPHISTGDRTNIYVDGVLAPFSGTVTWIAEEAEFTPKTILTQETRDTLVYAVKIEVPNSSRQLKIGMPVEVTFGDQ